MRDTRYILCFLVFLFSLPVFSQGDDYRNRSTKDLKSFIESTENNHNKLDAIHEMTHRFADLDADQVINYGKQGLLLAEQVNNLPLKISILNDLGRTYMMSGNHQMAIASFNEHIDLINFQIGQAPNQQAEYLSKIVASYSNLGNSFIQINDYKKALTCFLKSYQTADEHQIVSKLEVPLNDLIKLYSHFNYYDQVKQYLHQLEQFHNQFPEQVSEVGLHLGRGNIALYEGRTDSAGYYFTAALAETKSQDNIHDELFTLIALAKHAITVGEITDSHQHAMKALGMATHWGNKLQQANALNTLAKASYLNKAYQPAISFANKAIDIAKPIHANQNIAAAFNTLSNCYRATDDINLALKNKEQEQHALKQQLKNERAVFEANLKINNEMEQIHSEMASLKQEQVFKNNASQKFLIYFGFFFLIVSSIGLYFFNLQKSKRIYKLKLDEAVRNRTIELQQKNQQLNETLKEMEQLTKILSHDHKAPARGGVGFSDLATKNIKNKEYDRLTNHLEFISKNSKQLYRLLQNTDLYSNVETNQQQVQSLDVNKLVFQIYKELTTDTNQRDNVLFADILPKIIANRNALLPVFKNVILNGWTFNKKKCPTININYRQSDDSHVFEISDDGLGLESFYFDRIFDLQERLNRRAEEERIGLGLAISKKIITQLGGDISILKSQIGVGTTVQIILPIIADPSQLN